MNIEFDEEDGNDDFSIKINEILAPEDTNNQSISSISEVPHENPSQETSKLQELSEKPPLSKHKNIMKKLYNFWKTGVPREIIS